MKRSIIWMLLVFSAAACSKEPAKDNNLVEIPGSVTTVETGLVGSTIIRVIQHNMEINPLLQIEILSRPNFDVVQTALVDSIQLKDETLSFTDGSGAYVEAVEFTDDEVLFEFDYIPRQGSSQIYQCRLKINKANFGPYICDKDG